MSPEAKTSEGIASALGSPEVKRGFIKRFWQRWEYWMPPIGEGQLFLFLAVVIGIFAGLGVVLFRIAIEWTQIMLLGPALHPSTLRLLLAPTLAGLVVAALVIHVFPRVRGSGVNQTKAAVYIFDGYIPFSTAIGKFITCALAIGSGQSLGPEDPSLQIGAGIASKLGRSLKLSQEKIRLIAPVGAAAGLAAAFNAPISAVIFVIEEVIGNWSGGVLGAIILAAVSSVVVMRQFLGTDALFRIPPFRLEHPSELLAYAVLGIVGGGASVLFIQFITFTRPRLKRLPHWTQYFQPAVAGFLIGVIGLRAPQVMGAGYPIIDWALHDQFTWNVLLALGACKILATGLSFVSGTPGGMFAPTLFVGAMIGGAVGGVEHLLFHQITGSVGAFALVGMGTLFAGFLRAPITSVFMVIEVSGSYTAILPVMISNTIAYLISRQYQSAPLFDVLARQDGMILPSIEEEREHMSLRVENAMPQLNGDSQSPEAVFAAALERAGLSRDVYFLSGGPGGWRVHRRKGAPIDADDGDVGGEGPPQSAGAIETSPYLFPDQRLEEALAIMQDWPVLPIISRADPQELEGVLTLPDVLKTYRGGSHS
ncbi:MAG: chloride channel protein [Candidatus Acidiferrales bacterium]